jgi:hypothetical protein
MGRRNIFGLQMMLESEDSLPGSLNHVKNFFLLGDVSLPKNSTDMRGVRGGRRERLGKSKSFHFRSAAVFCGREKSVFWMRMRKN